MADAAGSPQQQFHPPNVWGLDYHFKMFNKMYIRDILEMEPYPMFPGAWAYKNHPIYKVDVMGVVVKVLQNTKCFMYTVDDGTGVIVCCCWKDSFQSDANTVSGCSYDDLPGALRGKAQEFFSSTDNDVRGYELGDLLHVRGQLKVFRNEMEIISSYHSVVEDPMFEVLRITELPLLYRQGYNKHFKLPNKVQVALNSHGQDSTTGTGQLDIVVELKKAIVSHLRKTVVVEVHAQDLLHQELVKTILQQRKPAKAAGSAGHSEDFGLVLQTLHSIEEDGYVARRSDRRMLYEVLFHESKLEKRILQILRAEIIKPKFEGKGCHSFHVTEELHRTLPYAKVKNSSVVYCLQKLELQSDVIRTTKYLYMPCAI